MNNENNGNILKEDNSQEKRKRNNRNKDSFDRRKYSTVEDLEDLCSRLITLHNTGVYTPPKPKPYACQNKNKNRNRGKRVLIPRDTKDNDNWKKNTSFGKGRVGVSCDSYGIKNCSCCNPQIIQQRQIMQNFFSNQAKKYLENKENMPDPWSINKKELNNNLDLKILNDAFTLGSSFSDDDDPNSNNYEHDYCSPPKLKSPIIIDLCNEPVASTSKGFLQSSEPIVINDTDFEDSYNNLEVIDLINMDIDHQEVLEESVCDELVVPEIKDEIDISTQPSSHHSSVEDIMSFIDSITQDIDFEEEAERLKIYEENFLKTIKSEANAAASCNDTIEESSQSSVGANQVNLSTIETINENLPQPADINVACDEPRPSTSSSSQFNESVDKSQNIAKELPNTTHKYSKPVTRSKTQKPVYHSTPRVKSRFNRKCKPNILSSKSKPNSSSLVSVNIINSSNSIINISDSSNNSFLNLDRGGSSKARTQSKLTRKENISLINLVDDDADGPSINSNNNTAKPTKEDGIRKSFDCPICLESLARKDIMSTICGHIFCSECIKAVIKSTKRCPNCRKPLTLKSIHPIYI